jgi:hypothetical protein
MNERREIPVHPNSTAARKWRRTSWTTSSPYFAAAFRAEKRGDSETASALRRAAGRRSASTLHCG